MTKLDRSAMQAEALDRARTGQTFANYPAIFEGFIAKGIAPDQIQPRENVFTFHAWKALGRSVKKGEHGVKVFTFIETSRRDPSSGDVETFRRPKSTTVFHISQTEEASARPARGERRPAAYPDPGELTADRWNETHA